MASEKRLRGRRLALRHARVRLPASRTRGRAPTVAQTCFMVSLKEGHYGRNGRKVQRRNRPLTFASPSGVQLVDVGGLLVAACGEAAAVGAEARGEARARKQGGQLAG